ncbi:MAG: type IV pilus twitching motility protein PilT [Abitibacteriaceae bacterium]|nr:type IV pilus twitching motility protein PilT [Abditibacteriaceae bacterium]
MAQIDNFIAMMQQKKVERAVLINDKPAHLFAHGDDSPGPIIPGAKLHEVVQEVTPPPLRPQLGQDGGFHFPYQSPHGIFEIGVARGHGTLQVTIAPPVQANGNPSASLEAAISNLVADINPSPSPSLDGQPPAPEVARVSPMMAGGHSEKLAVATAATRGTKHIGHIDELFHMMRRVEASDLHLSSKEYPMMRVHGVMTKLEEYAINTHDDLKKLLWAIAPPRNQQEWDAEHDTDFAYELEDIARFRCNYFMDRHGIGAVFRLIPSDVWTVEDLKLPQAMIDLCYLSKGLVVVTGPTGSGKSTTLAALIDYVNKHREDHIITIEDPVEFVHNNIRCLINQREVHVATDSFARALRASLREDPDIILVGEMRDLETTKLAIEAAETGHLVFGTLHTSSAPSTVDRMIDQFPSEEQAQIRVMLSETIKGVIAQTLLRTKDGKRVAAYEILLVPAAVANLIREGKTFQLPSQMQIGKGQGMMTMNDSILRHVMEGRVDPHEGYVKAIDKVSLLQLYEAHDIAYNIGDGA